MKSTLSSPEVVTTPERLIVNAYTSIAAVYCASSAFLFFIVVGNTFLCVVHAAAFVSVVLNYLLLRRTQNYSRATTIILATGTTVVVSLFATGGWDRSGYLWPFAYLPFAYFLTVKRESLLWVAILFGGCLAATALHGVGIITIPYSPVAIGNYFFSLIIFTACMTLYQRARTEYQELAELREKNIIEKNRELDKEISERKQAEHELLTKTQELEQTNKFMVGRELRMVELKEEITTLKKVIDSK